MFAGILKRTSVRSKTKTCWNGKRHNRSRISSVDRPRDCRAGGCRFDLRDWTNSHTTLYLLYQLVKVFNPDGTTPSVRTNNRGTLLGCRSLHLSNQWAKKKKEERKKERKINPPGTHWKYVEKIETHVPNVWNKWCYHRWPMAGDKRSPQANLDLVSGTLLTV